jgi:hypothetical protein
VQFAEPLPGWRRQFELPEKSILKKYEKAKNGSAAM